MEPPHHGMGWNNAEQLDTLIAKVKRGIGRLVDAYQDGLLERAEFEPRLQRAKERLTKLTEEARTQADQESQQKELQLDYTRPIGPYAAR